MDEMRDMLLKCGYIERQRGRDTLYVDPITHRALLIYYADARKIRLCAENIGAYAAKLPQALRADIARAPNCGGACRPWGRRICTAGWKFEMDGIIYSKCRYGAFTFKLDLTDARALCDMLALELMAGGHFAE